MTNLSLILPFPNPTFQKVIPFSWDYNFVHRILVNPNHHGSTLIYLLMSLGAEAWSLGEKKWCPDIMKFKSTIALLYLPTWVSAVVLILLPLKHLFMNESCCFTFNLFPINQYKCFIRMRTPKYNMLASQKIFAKRFCFGYHSAVSFCITFFFYSRTWVGWWRMLPG